MFCYLDNAATTKPYNEVCDLMDSLARNCYGNPSSIHSFGLQAERELDQARNIISHSLDVKPKEIIFTSSATESNNLAISGFLNRNPHAGKHIIISSIEHPSVVEVVEEFEMKGYEIDRIPVNHFGVIDLGKFQSLLREDTALVSVMLVNNEMGSIQPVAEIKKIMKSSGCKGVLHVDAVQAYCKIGFSAKKIGAELITISGHKVHGPRGAAALFVKEGINISPIILGGMQEKGLRSGTENMPAICGFGRAVELSMNDIKSNFERISEMNRIFYENIDAKTVVSHTDKHCSPYIINISVNGIRSEVMLHHMESVGVYVSSGSACTSKKKGKGSGRVLSSLGKSHSEIDSSIRISFGNFNTLSDVLYAAEQINFMIKLLRRKDG